MFRVRKGIRYRRRKKIAVGIVLVTILLILLGGLIFRIAKRTIPEVILKVKNVSILQDEEIPQIQAAASCKDEKYSEKELEKGYTVKDFVKDLNAGKGYRLTYEIDQTKEGECRRSRWRSASVSKWQTLSTASPNSISSNSRALRSPRQNPSESCFSPWRRTEVGGIFHGGGIFLA